ncbi:MAG TPA: SDR family oxidoreductase [Candidatus Kapabacteria bacterium]|nr:SDR family oxidoreductase [Candidatus Kapabacteria bacterium]
MSDIPSSIYTPADNQYALVLGASSGFGGACALALAKAGMNILGVHLDRAATIPNAEKIKKDIESLGRRAIFWNVNAADPATRGTIIEDIKKEFASQKGTSTVRVLLHSLAFGTLKPFISVNQAEELNQKQMEMTLDVMANSLVYWSQDIIHNNLMLPGGRIYAMTSQGGQKVLPAYGAVSAAKAALESHIRQIAFESGKFGITANAVRAGVTDTPAFRKIPNTEILINNALRRNPFGRLTTPEDVATALINLCKPEMYWVNGNVLGVDGGEGAVDF